MEMVDQPHVVMISVLLQGHVKPLLCLAELLSEAGLFVTFVNTHHNHKRFSNLPEITNNLPNLHFVSISDGLPDDHPRDSFDLEYFFGINSATKPYFKELILSYLRDNSGDAPLQPRVSCIIADGVFSFPIDVAEELEIPIFSFIAHSARYLWEYFTIPKLIHGVDDHDHHLLPSDAMPGFELGRNDLPGFNMETLNSPVVQFLVGESLAMTRTSGLILNTIDDLEASCLPYITHHFRKLYTVGPLHVLLNSRVGDRSQLMASHGSFWKSDQNCMTWLDSQPSRSVLYVSFGSVVKTSCSNLLEFWHGLVDSGRPFLWVLRRDVISDGKESNGEIYEELQKGPKERVCIVEWAPQEQVLGHSAIGGFLTHCGWNSILENIVARVPMICWPNWGDQSINSECVVKLWKFGVELDAKDRSSIEKTINTLMGHQREELQLGVDRIAKRLEDGIHEGGSSYNNVEMLVGDLRKMKLLE
ncbi:hypothetical protein FNV43_RR09755 [Rhamnella rubrinervis]|uniref:Glycosyltransferase n=1 Tax=Rhamnella rubrinervis TaxID=2594499 RepID=A0A8K0MK30_9ROSA|nr:hypothetical protein FNV43_RR09755 [Rhamnella rubrinervis]